MSKYPLDQKTIQQFVAEITNHTSAQDRIIADLTEILRVAMECVDDEDENPWIQDAKPMLATLLKRKIDFDNHHFNQSNGHSIGQFSPYPVAPGEPIVSIDLQKEAELNAHEAAEFGAEMSEAEIAAMLDKPMPTPKIKKKKEKKLNKMTLEEIEDWERRQDNSNDIYKVSARIKNLARAGVKANLTPQGDMVCNTFTHLIKNLYDFAETVHDKETRTRLKDLVKKQEEAPAGLIAALSAGVRAPT